MLRLRGGREVQVSAPGLAPVPPSSRVDVQMYRRPAVQCSSGQSDNKTGKINYLQRRTMVARPLLSTRGDIPIQKSSADCPWLDPSAK